MLIEYRKLADGTELEIQHVVKPHSAKHIAQVPATKKSYRGKNDADGRKCLFQQSPAYKRKAFYPLLHINNPWSIWERRAIGRS